VSKQAESSVIHKNVCVWSRSDAIVVGTTMHGEPLYHQNSTARLMPNWSCFSGIERWRTNAISNRCTVDALVSQRSGLNSSWIQMIRDRGTMGWRGDVEGVRNAPKSSSGYLASGLRTISFYCMGFGSVASEIMDAHATWLLIGGLE
jgi:hypothetical protein